MKSVIKNTSVVFLILVGGIFFIFSHQLGGFRTFIVTSGSMKPILPIGSVILTQYVKPSTLQKGDVITFLPPIPKREFVTHRVTKMINQKLLTTFKTKGDNNDKEDTWTLAGGAIVGRVVLTIPILGYILSFTQSKVGILLFILFPSLFIILSEIQHIIKLFKTNKKISQETQVTTICLLFVASFIVCSPQPTHALLADGTSLTNNQITVETTRRNHGKGHNDKDKHHDKDDKDNDEDDE